MTKDREELGIPALLVGLTALYVLANEAAKRRLSANGRCGRA